MALDFLNDASPLDLMGDEARTHLALAAAEPRTHIAAGAE